jgi:RND family efflux transporter MFP subunit
MMKAIINIQVVMGRFIKKRYILRHYDTMDTMKLRLALSLVLLILLATSCDKAGIGEKKTLKERIVEVKTLKLTYTDYRDSFSVKGYTEPVYSIDIKPQVGGKVLRVLKQEGDSVRKGELLLIIDPRDIELRLRNLLHEKEALSVKLRTAERAFRRRENLYRRELISREEFERFEGEYRSLVANLKALESRVELLRRELEKTRILSPERGFILHRYVQEGEVVAPQSRLFTLVKLSPLWFTFRVPYEDLRYVREGKFVSVHIGDMKLVAGIDHILPSADKDKLFTVRVKLDNVEEKMRPLTYGVVHVPKEEIRAFRIPEQALQVSQRKSFLWKVENSRAKSVSVKVLAHRNGYVFVTSPQLKEGDRIVVEGFVFLSEGVRVKEE